MYGIFTVELMYNSKSIIKIKNINFVKKLKQYTLIFENRKAETLAECFVFQTIFRHRGGYSAKTTTTSTVFLFYNGNTIGLNVFLYRKTKSVNL